MRTLILTKERSAKDNIDDVMKYFHNENGDPITNILTGLFAYDDRDPYLCNTNMGRRTYNHSTEAYEAPPLSSKMRVAITRWCERGKGISIIHGRNIPRVTRANKERMPYKISSTEYFYHLGCFGQNEIWNIVRTSRNARAAVNAGIYSSWKVRVMEQDNIEEWNEMHRLEDDVYRSWSTLLWNDGEIVKYDTWDSDTDTSTYQHYKPVDYMSKAVLDFPTELPDGTRISGGI